MAKVISTEITIKASPERVWSILTNIESFPQWNPFIKSIAGHLAVGERLLVNIHPPGGKAMTFKPVIQEYVIHNKWSWLGQLLFKGVFDGLHSFTLKPNPDGTTLFIHEEKFSGILTGILNLENTKKGFVAMNGKLKEMAESEL